MPARCAWRRSPAYDVYLSVLSQFDYLAGARLAEVILPRLHYIIHARDNLGGNLGEVGGRWLPADVGAGAHHRLLEAVTEFVADSLPCHAHAHTAILGDEFGREVARPVQDEGERFAGKLDEVPGDIGHAEHITLQAVGTVHEADECLAVFATLEAIHLPHGLAVGGIATDAPDGVCGIEDKATLAHRLHGLAYILGYFFLCHSNM